MAKVAKPDPDAVYAAVDDAFAAWSVLKGNPAAMAAWLDLLHRDPKADLFSFTEGYLAGLRQPR